MSLQVLSTQNHILIIYEEMRHMNKLKQNVSLLRSAIVCLNEACTAQQVQSKLAQHVQIPRYQISLAYNYFVFQILPYHCVLNITLPLCFILGFVNHLFTKPGDDAEVQRYNCMLLSMGSTKGSHCEVNASTSQLFPSYLLNSAAA